MDLQELDLEVSRQIGDLLVAKARGATGMILVHLSGGVGVFLSYEPAVWIAPAIAAAALGTMDSPEEYHCYDFECTDERGGQIRLTPWRGGLTLAIEDRKTGDSAVINFESGGCAEAAVAMSSLLHEM